jgi:hypothetical protein
MPLDLSAIHPHIRALVDLQSPEKRMRLLREARSVLQRADPDKVRDSLEVRKKRYPWLVDNPLNSLRDTFAVPPLPSGGYQVAASDGSNIPPDRHSPVRYCVLNISKVVLAYGANPMASLTSVTEMLYKEEDLSLDGAPLRAELLGAKMAVRELEVLLETALALSAPCVALHDGTLILWPLQNQPDPVRDHFTRPFRRALDGFLAERIPLLSYISYPSARDLCNALRVALCDTDTSECKTCKSDHRELCEFLGELRDRELLQGVLEPGKRTDLFATVSDVVRHYGGHDIVFCYLDVGGEIARVEMPKWVAEDEEALNLGLGVVLDQCALSGDVPPYPLALMEAHEAAVIDVAMRTVVEELVEGEFARHGLPYIRSGKDRSKRRRGV